jgi:hypothetical protein
VEQQQAAISD